MMRQQDIDYLRELQEDQEAEELKRSKIAAFNGYEGPIYPGLAAEMHRALSTNQVPYSDPLAVMQAIADQFYRAAVHQPCHAFVEFAGLMNEYIKICAENDYFLAANRHTGAPMQVPPFRIDYIREKLECIFSPFANVSISPLPAASDQ